MSYRDKILSILERLPYDRREKVQVYFKSIESFLDDDSAMDFMKELEEFSSAQEDLKDYLREELDMFSSETLDILNSGLNSPEVYEDIEKKMCNIDKKCKVAQRIRLKNISSDSYQPVNNVPSIASTHSDPQKKASIGNKSLDYRNIQTSLSSGIPFGEFQRFSCSKIGSLYKIPEAPHTGNLQPQTTNSKKPSLELMYLSLKKGSESKASCSSNEKDEESNAKETLYENTKSEELKTFKKVQGNPGSPPDSSSSSFKSNSSIGDYKQDKLYQEDSSNSIERSSIKSSISATEKNSGSMSEKDYGESIDDKDLELYFSKTNIIEEERKDFLIEMDFKR